MPDKPRLIAPQDHADDLSRAQALVPYPYGYPDDEIDLINVGVSLLRRWKLMALVFLICTAGAVALAVLTPRVYRYTAVIQIGNHTTPQGNSVIPMESPHSAVATLQNAYLPEETEKYAAAHGIPARKISITAKNPEKTQVVVLSGKTTGKLGAAYIAIEAAAAKRVVADDARISNVIHGRLTQQLTDAKVTLKRLENKAYYEARVKPIAASITSARLKLAALQDPASYQKQKMALEHAFSDAKATLANRKNEVQVLRVTQDTLQKSIHLRQQEARELKQHLAMVRKSIMSSADGLSGPSQAMSALLLSTEEQRTINQLNGVENALTVTLPQSMANVAQKIRQNKRQQRLEQQVIARDEQNLASFEFTHRRLLQQQRAAIAAIQPKLGSFEASHAAKISDQKATIRQIETEIANIQETKLATPPARSMKPSGLSRTMVVVLGIVVGMMLSVLAAAIANYLFSVHRRLRMEVGRARQ